MIEIALITAAIAIQLFIIKTNVKFLSHMRSYNSLLIETEHLKNKLKVLEVRTAINRDRLELIESGLDILFTELKDERRHLIQ